jgi:DnaJ-class molecular chaperone
MSKEDSVISYNHKQTSIHIKKIAEIQVATRGPEVAICSACKGNGFSDDFDHRCPFCGGNGFVDWVQRMVMTPYPNLFRRRNAKCNI